MTKKFYTLFVLALLTMTAQAQDDLTWWGYYTSQETGLTGSYGLGDYEVAMFIPGDGDMKGVSIEAIRAQTRNYSFTKNFKFWVRTSLDGENLAEATPSEVAQKGTTTATFSEPFAIPETGIYVGYSFNVYTYDDYEYFSMPVVYAKTAKENTFFLKKPGDTNFTDKSSMGSATIQIGFKAPAATMWWGNYTGAESTGLAGNNKLGNYEAAMFVAGDGALGGADITAMRAQTRLYSNAKDFKFWVRATLDGENLAEAVPEKVSSSSTEWTEAQFANAVTIPETGCYVGYSFNLSSWLSDYDYTPVVYAKKVVEKGFYLMQPGETEFTDKSSTGCLAAQIEVSGSNMAADAVQVADDIDDMVALVGEPIVLSLNLTNQGSAGVKSIDFSYNLDGEQKEGHLDLDPAIDAMLGAKGAVTVELGAPAQAGQQEIELAITKVNGNDNAITGKKAKCSVVVTVLSESAPRTAVVEMFVGTSQYWSPRAYVAVDLMKQNSNIIPFLVDHYNGSFKVESYAEFQKNYTGETTYTNKYTSYPVAEVNRSFTTDPYYGNATAAPYSYQSEALVKATLSKATEAGVSLTAEWTSEAQNEVTMNASATFLADFKSAPYRLAFVLIADGLKRDVNSYVSYYKSSYPDDDMTYWREGDGASWTVKDYVHNNMAIAASDVTGIVSSLPKKLTAGEAYTYESTLALPEWEGQTPENVRAVVLLINKDTKEIVNAAIAPVLTHDETTGIKNVVRQQADNVIYNLNGQKVQQAQSGLYIVNGRKVVLK